MRAICSVGPLGIFYSLFRYVGYASNSSCSLYSVRYPYYKVDIIIDYLLRERRDGEIPANVIVHARWQGTQRIRCQDFLLIPSPTSSKTWPSYPRTTEVASFVESREFILRPLNRPPSTPPARNRPPSGDQLTNSGQGTSSARNSAADLLQVRIADVRSLLVRSSVIILQFFFIILSPFTFIFSWILSCTILSSEKKLKFSRRRSLPKKQKN